MNKKWPSLKDGDVFKIPLGDGRAAVGQVVSKYLSVYYVVIFDFVAPEEQVPSRVTEALGSEPLFAGLSRDALFRPERWQVLENRPVDSRKFLPAYKVGWRVPGQYVVEDFWGTRRRPATDLEEQILPFRATNSAAIFEDAIRAHVGLEPWDEFYDELRVGKFVKSADLFDD
ncbi:immunity 26/phosphotriesterase HocA family protein [Arthrobacter zhaoxinii]|uniref:Immunity 26/phosphotriesterase HocA family protein n=1 Tax=Arthrobacter zhaoxinii TaxID=2964616 RepID=A0ABY5YUL0_9MICC|nr:immunity 26/phosphotriesterase HocA family protein [Arthrobacter zhaoxinii]UWX98480.1 immunity 26/phosphotriesterase HocA family protein [Arthrobacter zhaoxinii]